MAYEFETPIDDINAKAIEEIRDLMKRYRRSVASIANATGINQRTLYKYLNEGTDINLFNAYRLATCFWVSPNDIWSVGIKPYDGHKYWWDEKAFNALNMERYLKLATETLQGAIDSANCRVPISSYCKVQDISRNKFYRAYRGERIPGIGFATSLAAYAGRCPTDIWRYPQDFEVRMAMC